jgi:hypothetical protein
MEYVNEEIEKFDPALLTDGSMPIAELLKRVSLSITESYPDNCDFWQEFNLLCGEDIF